MSDSKSDDGPRILLLDGGMGTTLESLGYDVGSSLWGSELISTDPEAISKVHRGYANAGADLIETATYQITPSNLASYLSNGSEKCHQGRAWRIMHRSVSLVSDAISSTSGPTDHGLDPRSTTEEQDSGGAKGDRTQSLKRIQQQKKGTGVVLSCGPYGSTLSPGQEYGGIYPPPFGPSTKSNAFPAPLDNIRTSTAPVGTGNAASPQTPQKGGPSPTEEEAIEALATFHLDKLKVFAMNEETWRSIEWLAFETIPVLHEIRAIRLAMRRLNLGLERTYSENRMEERRLDERRGVWRFIDWDAKLKDVVAVSEAGKSAEGDSQRGDPTSSDDNEHGDEEGPGDAEAEAAEQWWRKRFWITSPFPNGLHPQLRSEPTGSAVKAEHVSVSQVVEAMVGGDEIQGDALEVPDGIGINCTHPKFISALSREFTSAYRDHLAKSNTDKINEINDSSQLTETGDEQQGKKQSGEDKIRFVIYPDGGQVYDTVTRQWSDSSSPKDADEWAKQILDVVQDTEQNTVDPVVAEGDATRTYGTKVWGGVIVGGCCKTSFDEIAALRKAIDEA